jgi:hypothetical protein
MQLKALPRPRITMRIATNEVRKLMQRGPLVVGAEEHFTRFSDHPTKRMGWLTSRSGVVVNAHPFKFAFGTSGGFCEELERWAPARPCSNSETTHRTNFKW